MQMIMEPDLVHQRASLLVASRFSFALVQTVESSARIWIGSLPALTNADCQPYSWVEIRRFAQGHARSVVSKEALGSCLAKTSRKIANDEIDYS
jgi:hypothetical protein